MTSTSTIFCALGVGASTWYVTGDARCMQTAGGFLLGWIVLDLIKLAVKAARRSH